jgi:hypothetical protein
MNMSGWFIAKPLTSSPAAVGRGMFFVNPVNPVKKWKIENGK